MPTSPTAAESVAHVALLIALVLTAAKVGGEIAVRLKQSAVLGELLAGMLLGNLPWFPWNDPLGLWLSGPRPKGIFGARDGRDSHDHPDAASTQEGLPS